MLMGQWCNLLILQTHPRYWQFSYNDSKIFFPPSSPGKCDFRPSGYQEVVDSCAANTKRMMTRLPRESQHRLGWTTENKKFHLINFFLIIL